ncbi:MAG: hypothetical protein RLZZ361_1378 [Cyanobacteriota bacterium]
MSNNYDLIDIARRNEIIDKKKQEIFEDYKNNLLSYSQLAKKYDLKLYDILKIVNSDEFKQENQKILEARAVNYVNQIGEEIEKISEDSSNSFVAKQKLKVENLRWLARTTSPKIFNENYQIAMIRSEQESQQAVVPELKIILNNN